MLTSVSRYFKDNLVAFLALFVALGGTGAYAANTIGSTDIIDGQVNSADVKDQSLTTFDVSTFLGADVVDGTLTSADIADFTLKDSDVATNTLTGDVIASGAVGPSEVADNTLNDEDVSQSHAVNFPANIGVVNATSCVNRQVTGLNAAGDHVLLTPSIFDANGALMYDARYNVSTNDITIHVCNFSNANIDDGTTTFNALVFDAQ